MVTKGEKLGHFAYGGSLIILLFEKNRYNLLFVQQGEQIGISRKQNSENYARKNVMQIARYSCFVPMYTHFQIQ